MKLSKLYSNQPDKFEPILFKEGLNFIYGDIRHPKNKDLDSHNLGKTTLALLLDFMFLAKWDKKQFLYANIEIFNSFVFFLEIYIGTNHYLTIRRSVAEGSKASFITHEQPNQNYKNLADNQWDYFELPFAKARSYLDGELNLTGIRHWDYRKLISYLIRTQNDFGQVFRLSKHRGKDVDWKPYMADLLGFNGDLARQRYDILKQETDIKNKIKEKNTFEEKSISEALSKIDNRLLLKRAALNETQAFVDKFDFYEIDKQTIQELVAEIDSQIIYFNMREYSLKNTIYHIEQSFTGEKIKFDPNEVKELFEEVNILFPDQVIKDFEQLIAFNKAITKERNNYLKQELKANKLELENVIKKLQELNEERSQHLHFLKESELINKLKESNHQIATIQAEILSLEQQYNNIYQILDLQKKQRELKSDLDNIENEMQIDVAKINNISNGIFAKIRLFFNEIIAKVLNKSGELLVFLNKEGNLEFQVEYQDKMGKNTSESKGNTYQKFLCIAFDLAVTRAYLDQEFPQFIYIDGVFDGLDDRKKELLLEILREYSKKGIQIIATTINSEVQGLSEPIPESEITLILHDDGQDGRLFKLPIW